MHRRAAACSSSCGTSSSSVWSVGSVGSVWWELRRIRVIPYQTHPTYQTYLPPPHMFVLARAVTYAALFIGFLLIYLPARVLSAWGVTPPATIGWPQATGVLIGSIGAALALTCIFTFAVVGKGTPAPFDPPRRLVVRGPYRVVRNPMYLGATLALAGGALVLRVT